MNFGQTANQTAQGAALGASIGGPVGAAIGGGTGFISSFFGDDPEEQAKQAQRLYEAKVKAAGETYSTEQGQILDEYGNLYTPADIAFTKMGYQSALGNANPSQYKVNAGDYTQTYTNPLGNWSEYLDPSIKYQQESARKNIEESAAGQGGLYSGAAANEIAKNVADIASTGYNNAYDKARAAVIDQNAIRSNNLTQGMQAGNYNQALDQTNISNLGSAYGLNRDLMDTEMSGRSDLNKTMYNTATGMANAGLSSDLGSIGGQSGWDQFIQAGKTANDAGVFDYFKDYTGKR